MNTDQQGSPLTRRARKDSAVESPWGRNPAAVRQLLTVIGDKWSIFLLLSLAKLPSGRARFSELEKTIPGISRRMLALTLKNLERNGLIRREAFAQFPPRVDYELTGLAKSLLRPMQGLMDWAVENCARIKKTRPATHPHASAASTGGQ